MFANRMASPRNAVLRVQFALSGGSMTNSPIAMLPVVCVRPQSPSVNRGKVVKTQRIQR